MLIITFFSCEKKDDSIIDPSYKSPLISNPYRSKDTVFTTSGAPVISFNTSVFVDENGGGTVNSVTCKIYSPGNILEGTFTMHDDGIAPDSNSGDGRYSVAVNITSIQCLLVGNYSIRYLAQNTAGLNSNQINSSVIVIDTSNQPPVLSNPDLPDSVVRPVSGSFDLTISLTVTDPDGSCDINQVYFDAYRPSGNYIGRIPMTAAGNNIYSFTNPVLPSTSDSSYGYFKYYFQAQDNSSVLSSVLKDSIKFVRPPAK